MKDITGAVVTTGNVDTSNSKQGSISKRGMGVVMSILSKMYSNAPLAVLREYSCNARDSHIASGQTRPIEVTLPSGLQPTLLIQDFGLGMTRDDIERFFLEYGETTKDDTNDLVGAFGIGSKSAFTLGHQFIVTGVKDGHKTVAMLALDGNNVLTCTIIREQETTEPNGVLISLAVDDVQAMRETAEHFFSFWTEGTVLVDGQTPERLVTTRGNQINDASWLVQEHDGNVIVEMGQVPYVVGRDILRKVARDLTEAGDDAAEQAKALVDWYSSTSLVFHVEIGDCDIAPNREALRDTPHTLNTLKALLQGLVRDLAVSVQTKIDACPSPFWAGVIVKKALDDLEPFKVPASALTFGNVVLSKEVTVKERVLFLRNKSYRSTVKIVDGEDHHTVDSSRAPRTVVVTGVSEDNRSRVSRYAKRFLEEYTYIGQDGESISPDFIIVTDKPTGEYGWFTWGEEHGAHTMTLEGYRAALRGLRDSNPRTKSEPSYTTGWARAERDLDDRDLLTDILDWGKDLIVYSGSAQHVGSVAREALADYTPVVLLGAQSVDMLEKRVVADGRVRVLDHSEVNQIVADYAAAEFESITRDEKDALGALHWLDSAETYEYDQILRAVGGDESVITSPTYKEARDAIDLAHLVAQDISQERKDRLTALARYLGKEVEYPEYAAVLLEAEDVWPLAMHCINRGGVYAFARSETLRSELLALINAK